MSWNSMLSASHSIILSVGSVGNLLVILVTIKCRQFHTMRFLLLASLSLSDLLFHVLVMPFYAISLARGEWIFGFAWCQATVYLTSCLGISTDLHLCVVTWDCHRAVTKPFSFCEKITFKKLIALAFVWIFPLVFSSTLFYGWGKIVYSSKIHRCERTFDNVPKFISLTLIFFVIPLLIITKQQLEIRRIVKVQTRKMNVLNQKMMHTKQEYKGIQQNIKASKEALIIVGAFLCSYFPMLVCGAFRIFLPTSEVVFTLWSVSFCIFHAGAAWNPIIYSARRRQFRRELFSFFKRRNNRVAPPAKSYQAFQ